ncbi:MAG: heavy-metal transporter, partial [Epsilonproteobacteria bacterium]|nr:heavy-metal transporter [Campylobacterota bacterium]
FSWRTYRTKCVTCNLQKKKQYGWMYGVILGVMVLILLYPEFAQFFLEGEE